MPVGIPVMEYSLLEAIGTKELQRRLQNVKINAVCLLCHSTSWQGQAYLSLTEVGCRLCA